MRGRGWTPSIVPGGDDQTVYLVKDDLGRLGAVWREADAEAADLETVITDLMAASTKTRYGSSPSTLTSGGRRTSPKMSPARSAGASTCSSPTFRWASRILWSDTKATTGSSRCGWSSRGGDMIFLGLDTEQASDRMEQFLIKLVDAEAHCGTPQFDTLMAEAYALYEKLPVEERLWFDEKAEEIGQPAIN